MTAPASAILLSRRLKLPAVASRLSRKNSISTVIPCAATALETIYPESYQLTGVADLQGKFACAVD